MEQVYANSNRELLSFLIMLLFSQLYYFSFILERKQHKNAHFLHTSAAVCFIMVQELCDHKLGRKPVHEAIGAVEMDCCFSMGNDQHFIGMESAGNGTISQGKRPD